MDGGAATGILSGKGKGRRIKEEIQGETAEIKECLRDSMKTHYS